MALLEARGLTKWYPVRGSFLHSLGIGRISYVHAVDGLDFSIDAGEIVSVLGESGCGKSTLGRLIVMLEDRTGGELRFDERSIDDWSRLDPKGFRRRAQIVFQNPYESFDGRYTIGDILMDPLRIHGLASGQEAWRRIEETLKLAGLHPARDYLERYPHELSGGQLQRIAVVRALLVEPKLLVADEPVSMLDVSVRAEILNSLWELRQVHNTAVVFITHDVAVARYIADRVIVMYLGHIVETGPAQAVIDNPSHPYTRALVGASPTPSVDVKREKVILRGEPPTPIDPPEGCRFASRCPIAQTICREVTPRLRPVGKVQVACHLVE